jgi:hypothetical protein
LTCLQPKDITNDPDFLLNIAPGEGKKTLGIHSDTNNEVMCFPQLFPDGNIDLMQRDRKS